MITFFQCEESGQRLSILDYNESRSNVRYRTVVNDDQLAVLHLQSIDTEDNRPGILEADMSELISHGIPVCQQGVFPVPY